MPFTFSIFKNRSKHTWGVKIALKFLLFTVPIAFIFTQIFYQSSVRSAKPAPSGENADKNTIESAKSSSIQSSEKILAQKEPKKPEKAPTKYPQIQKQPNPTQVLNAFDQWIDDFKKISCLPAEKCTDHDPRVLAQFYQKGLALSRTRAKVFEDLIQNNPEFALKHAVPIDVFNALPQKIRDNIEIWEEGFGDLHSHYGCKGGNHVLCEEVNQLEVGKDTLTAHLFGKRKDFGSLKGAAFFGVRMGEHIAVAEESFRDLSHAESSVTELSFGGQEISFKSNAEKNLFVEIVETAELQAKSTMTTVKYPAIAGSNGVTSFFEKRYEVVSTPATWAAAHADASNKKGRLMCIGSAAENSYAVQILSEANLTNSQIWIGATDNPLQQGSVLNKETNSTEAITISASNGDWKWLSGDDVSSGYTNWINSQEPNSTNFSFAALVSTSGNWSEYNETLELPYIIEYDNGFEPRTNIAPIDGFRKVLVIPVRFRDEGHIYTNSNFPLVDNLGNPLYPGFQQDSFEPISQDDLAKTMEDVRQFYLRNSDGTFNLQPVITPTVTIDYDKYTQTRDVNDQDSLQFDASHELVGSLENYYTNTQILGGHLPNAQYKVARKSRQWDFDGPAFEGVLSVRINNANQLAPGNFTAPPEITFVGGNIDPGTGLPDPDFKPARAEAIINSKGELSRVKILDSGSFYHSTPIIALDGNASFDFSNGGPLIVQRGRVVVSCLIVSTFYDPGGTVGWGSLPGTNSWAKVPMPNPWYPQIDGGNGLSFGVTIAHEFGHNFSLQHANLYESHSEKPNSDEGEIIGYSNPYSIMGNRAVLYSGDLTVPSKVNMNMVQGFGLTQGTQMGVDVASMLSPALLQNTNLKEQNPTSSAHENTFRIYRHDYGHGPYTLRTGEYHLRFPPEQSLDEWLTQQNFRQELLIGGPGDGATGILDMTNASPKIVITEGGKGYAEEPEIKILDENNQTLLKIDPSWIQLRAGTEESSYKQAQLRDFSLGSDRGLRGMQVLASQFAPLDTAQNPFSAYWLSYRRSASEFGLTVINGHMFQQPGPFGPLGSIQHNLLDMTMETPHDFSDCFLMLGHTFSDYESDIHVTPVRKGGISPMEYIEVVFNMGTSSTAEVPSFTLSTTTQTPQVGQLVDISVDFASANASDFAFGWYTNEVMETDAESQADIRYEWVNQRLSYFEATAYANARGGHLACVGSQAELDQIFSLVNENRGLSGTPDYVGNTITTLTTFVWLGGSDSQQEGVWKWQNGEPFTFSKWGSVGIGEPDNYIDPDLISTGGQDGLALAMEDFPQGRQGEWNDLRLAEKLTFVIEYPNGKLQPQASQKVLNQSMISKKFDEPGYHVVRAVVSDMRGAIASRNLVFQVGDYHLEKNSPVSGTVRSDNGYVQGARVVFSKASVIEHNITMSGNEKDWFLPDGENDPLSYHIDGQKAPDLLLRRGEIHRFYFDDAAAKFGITFLDQPESEAPRVKINMLVTPRVDEMGTGYNFVPEVNSSETGLFSSYLSQHIGTIKDYQNLEARAEILGQQDEQFLITKPFAKALLSDTNITGTKIRPTEIDDFGNYITFGGQGNSRTNPPEATIRRSSLWEDYTDDNATIKAHVDGVGTISPVNTTHGFLATTWRDILPNGIEPDLIVWGTGSEFNGTLESRTINRITFNEIVVQNQGIEFEPNATMAMLHYPSQPFAMWTFDRHESMYDNTAHARYAPSPAWNNPVLPNNIIHYWSFDEDSGIEIINSIDQAKNILLSTWDPDPTADLSDENRSVWGIKGKALRLKATDLNATTVTGVIPAYPFTVATWLLPDTDASLSMTFAGHPLLSNPGAPRDYSLNTLTENRTTMLHQWGHVAVVAVSDADFRLYVDGFTSGNIANSSNPSSNLTINAFNGLIDELYIYNAALSDSQIRALAGREYLDLSGNKRHIVPFGDDFDMSSPNTMAGSDDNVPVPNNTPNNRVGRLGDSFVGEDHGRSIALNGDDYLDISNHVSDFVYLTEGTICFWVRTGDTDTPLLSASKTDDNDSYFQLYLNEAGFPEVVLMNDGTEATKYYSNTAVNDSTWHHLVFTISETDQSIWIDGQRKGIQAYAGGSGAQRGFFADIQGMDYIALGRHEDSNVTSFMSGNFDDVYIFDRILTQQEISFLYNLNQGRDQIPRLEAVVDAVGRVELLDNGDGYKEQPEAFFSYGQDGNSTQDLNNTGKSVGTFTDLDHSLNSSFHGNILYVEDEDQVYSYHYSRPDADTTWRRDGNNSAWRPFHLAVGIPEMNATSVDQILWTKKMNTLTEIRLPDDRNISRSFLEYVEHNGSNYIPTKGLFGYTTPPNLDVEGSPNDDNATGFALFFVDENTSAEITNPGRGLTANPFNNDSVRVSGRGFRPSQSDRIYFDDQFGDVVSVNVQINEEEEHGPRAAELSNAGTTDFRLITKINLGLNFTVGTTHSPNDTVIGIPTSQFIRQLRVGDLVELVPPGGNVGNFPFPDFVITEVLSDQSFVVADVQFDFSSGNIDLGTFSYSAILNETVGTSLTLQDLQGGFFPGNELHVYQPTSSTHNPFSSEYLFQDWTSARGTTGEPRNNDSFTDFNQSISHITIQDPGYGYLMPVVVSALGGTPDLDTLQEWVDENNTFPMFTHAILQIESNGTDANGSILETNSSIRVVDGGYGYADPAPVNPFAPFYTAPTITISGGGGIGAQATASMGERFVVPIGTSLVSIGILNPDLVDDAEGSSSLEMDENTSLVGGQVVVDANETSHTVTIQYNNATITELLAAVNGAPEVFHPDISIGGNASIIQGSLAQPLVEINATSLNAISLVTVTTGGRGYLNLDPDNIPTARLDFNASGLERNATLDLRLGGSITDISRCTNCDLTIRNDFQIPHFHGHTGAWIEIWDRGRDERTIDSRAFAVPKVRNGKIEKVVVVESGNGYIDPVVKVRGIAPRHEHYRNPPANNFETRMWMCGNLRETRGGELVKCGHIQSGLYPPENCPGEVDAGFPVGGTMDAAAIEAWQERHTTQPLNHICDTGGVNVNLLQGGANNLDYSTDTHTHYNVGFKSRVCGGTKVNFILLNDPYRHPYEDWEVWDANLTVITQQGRIKEVLVDYGGEMYINEELAVVGSGSGVDAIPVIRDDGLNSMIILDDPDLRNLELTPIQNPRGGGMGFIERPWTWDSSFAPTFGPREQAFVAIGAVDDEVGLDFEDFEGTDLPSWSLGGLQMENLSFGDQIRGISVRDSGLFNDNRVAGNVTIDYNGSASRLFQQGTAAYGLTFSLTNFALDQNATYRDENPQNDDTAWRWRSLYQEQPVLNIIDFDGSSINVMGEDSSDFIRANGSGNFLFSEEGRYFDLYVDENIPTNFFYGFGRGPAHLPAMGGSVTVVDSIPGSSWASREPLERNMSVYTDQNGYYLLPDLEPGMYNVAVFMEDENFQESTFRPEGVDNRISQIVYVPGMPELTLESDNYGYGSSKLIWSVNSRKLSRFSAMATAAQQEVIERKILEGIGAGFRNGDNPELVIVPYATNTSFARPHIFATGLIDGSLRIEIIDDLNTSSYNPGDKFKVYFSSTITGVDFVEDYAYSLSSEASWSGSADAHRAGNSRLEIIPNDGNGTNFIEVPLSTSMNILNSEADILFTAKVYDENGTDLSANLNNVNWNLVYDFNDTDTNWLAVINNLTGENTTLNVFSTMRMGRVLGFNIINPGTNYSSGSSVKLEGAGRGFIGSLEVEPVDGNITGVIITNRGIEYDGTEKIIIDDSNGTGAILNPVLGGQFYLEANFTNSNGEFLQDRVRLQPSRRNILTDAEKWLDLYMDSFVEPLAVWWNQDSDGDGITNIGEFSAGTNPQNPDTDGDGLNDFDENSTHGTNPLQADSDGDGLLDSNETIEGTDPLLVDSDGDGFSDFFEQNNPLLNPLQPNSVIAISGAIYSQVNYAGDFYLRIEQGSVDANGQAVELFENNESFELRSNTFPQTYQFNDLISGIFYKVSGYLDLDGNGDYDPGEIYAEWIGQPSRNTLNAHLVMKDVAPVIEFFDGYGDNIEAVRGEEISISVSAFDYPDDNWSSPLLVNAAPTPRSISLRGNALSILEINTATKIATVSPDASFGDYELIFTAKDILGTESDPVSRRITITDKSDPVITINFKPYLWPLGTPLDINTLGTSGVFSANDAPSQDLTGRVQITGTVNEQIIGEYNLALNVVDDFGRSTTAELIVKVEDQNPPNFTYPFGSKTIDWVVGTPFVIPAGFVTANDNLDGNLTDDIIFGNLDQLDVDLEGKQTISIAVSDQAGNMAIDEITVSFEFAALSLSGVAIDGYLNGALVTFRSSDLSLANQAFYGITDSRGAFKLDFLADELELIDTNKNGKLDPEEGTIEVTGGVDSVTNRTFGGTLSADPSATVVTPLTSIIVEMVKQGSSKEKAVESIADAFGIKRDIDITTFDPIENAGQGNVDAAKVLQSGAIVANIFKQTELFAKSSNIEVSDKSVSQGISEKIASMLQAGSINFTDFSDIEFVKNLTSETILQLDPNTSLNTDELNDFSELLVSSNGVLADDDLLTLGSKEMLKTLSQRQIAVEEEVIVKMDDIIDGKISFSNLNSSVSESLLIDAAAMQIGLNQFIPEAKPLDLNILYLNYKEGDVVSKLEISDGDGDEVTVSIISGNLDKDGDTNPPFGINNSYEIFISDLDDIKQLAGQQIELLFKLDDRGDQLDEHGEVLVKIKLSHSDELSSTNSSGSDSSGQFRIQQNSETTDLSILEGVLNENTSWYKSSWFGSYYEGTNGWIYHQKLGWLYIHPSSTSGFWCWDTSYESWWWSSKQNNTSADIFYFYLYSTDPEKTGWAGLDLSSNESRIYEFFKSAWILR